MGFKVLIIDRYEEHGVGGHIACSNAMIVVEFDSRDEADMALANLKGQTGIKLYSPEVVKVYEATGRNYARKLQIHRRIAAWLNSHGVDTHLGTMDNTLAANLMEREFVWEGKTYPSINKLIEGKESNY